MTKIQWTDETWNPLRGCSRVSEGCRNCYAERVAHRFSGPGLPYEGLTTPKGRWNGEIKLVPERLGEPLRWRKPRMVFVNSMSDLFHERVSFEYIAAVFGVMAAAPRHTFQVLTKRPDRAAQWFQWLRTDGPASWWNAIRQRLPDVRWMRAAGRPTTEVVPNVWLGVSVEDQATADERIPLLLQCDAAVLWVSYEPALGSVQWGQWFVDEDWWRAVTYRPLPRGLDWVVVGGESGPGARSCDVDWIRSAVRQCADAGVPVFVKQLGSRIRWGKWGGDLGTAYSSRCVCGVTNSKGGDMREWPADLRVRQWPNK